MDNAIRHAPVAVVESYHIEGVGGVLVVDGMPPSRIQIAPHDRVLSLLVRATGNVPGPDLSERANLGYELQKDGGAMWHRLNVSYDDNLTEVYPVLCTIADRVQLGGESFTDAVDAVLAGLGDILAGRGGLSHEKQVGLFGELAVLLSLARHATPAHAVAAWRGPDSEEHDFGLADADVEVKTTMSEHRSHWIGSVTQLLKTPGRDLFLLSIQITAAGMGLGTTLTGLVQTVRALPGVPLLDVDKALAAVGYRTRHADLYLSCWMLRTAPSFYLVDDLFPAITPQLIASGIPSPQRITDIRYRVDLDGMVAKAPLFGVTLTGASNT